MNDCRNFVQADADDLDAARAVLNGLKHRYQSTGIAPIYINTVRLRHYPLHTSY